MNLIQHLVLTNGIVLSQGQAWCDVPNELGNLFKDAAGKPLPKSVVIYLIVFSPEEAQLGEDDEVRLPAQYKILLAHVDGQGNPNGLLQNAKTKQLETLIIEIEASKVLFCCRSQDFNKAVTDFEQYLQAEDGNEDLKAIQQQQPQAAAAAPSS